MVRVGLDDFAARLVGKADGLVLPKRGQWIRQGQKFATLMREGRKAELVSPIEGEITDINEAALRDALLPGRDPYGEGWLMTVMSPDMKTNFRNLLNGTLARQWMKDAADDCARESPRWLRRARWRRTAAWHWLIWAARSPTRHGPKLRTSSS